MTPWAYLVPHGHTSLSQSFCKENTSDKVYFLHSPAMLLTQPTDKDKDSTIPIDP